MSLDNTNGSQLTSHASLGKVAVIPTRHAFVCRKDLFIYLFTCLLIIIIIIIVLTVDILTEKIKGDGSKCIEERTEQVAMEFK